jgi:hypothetical protein
VAVADHGLASIIKPLIGILRREAVNLSLDCLGDQITGPWRSSSCSGSVAWSSGCERARRVGSVMPYPFVFGEILVVINQEVRRPSYLLPTSEVTLARSARRNGNIGYIAMHIS